MRDLEAAVDWPPGQGAQPAEGHRLNRRHFAWRFMSLAGKAEVERDANAGHLSRELRHAKRGSGSFPARDRRHIFRKHQFRKK